MLSLRPRLGRTHVSFSHLNLSLKTAVSPATCLVHRCISGILYTCGNLCKVDGNVHKHSVDGAIQSEGRCRGRGDEKSGGNGAEQ